MIHWIGENDNPVVKFKHEMPAKIHIFRGNSTTKHYSTFSQIIFENVYHGIHRILTINRNGSHIGNLYRI